MVSAMNFWNPIVWLAALVIATIIAYIFAGKHAGTRSLGNKGMPFLSGNDEGANKQHLSASNIYWGFLEALKDYYKVLMAAHTGSVNDYAFWLLFGLVIAIFAVLL